MPSPWWVHPDRFVLIIMLPLAILICWVTPWVLVNNGKGYSGEVFLDQFFTLLFLSGLLMLAGGAFAAKRIELRQRRATQLDAFSGPVLDILFAFCIVAYAIWFAPIILRSPGLVLGAFLGVEGAVYEIREQAPNISGVTTLTQFGMSYVCIYAVSWLRSPERPRFRHHAYLVVILLAALFRASVNSERIALIECVFPLVVVACRWTPWNKILAWRILRQTAPILMIVGGPLVFAVFEINRSWLNHYQYEYSSMWLFVLERFGFYYVTSVNNLAGYLQMFPWPSGGGEWTFKWLYRFPVIGELMPQGALLLQQENWEQFLKEFASEEFNNTTGILVVHHDWGVLVGSLFLLAYGVFAGFAFRCFEAGRGFLQYFYPVVLYSLFEILRIGYVYDGRAVAAAIGIGLAFAGQAVWRKCASDPLSAAAPARS
ncbi:MAG: hypothetical protein QOD74_932 [Variibacter sp.]|nr:hypothetical protein [Variibacter sp.]